MKRSPYLLLILLLAVSLTFACDDKDDSSEEDEEASSTEDLEESLSESADGVDSTERDELADALGDALYKIMVSYTELPKAQCKCSYVDLGFSTAAECIGQVSQPDSMLQDMKECNAEAVRNSSTPPPAGVRDAIACINDSAAAGKECMDDIASDYDDQCSDPATAALQQCFQDMDAAGSSCEREADSETADWMENFATSTNCFDDLNLGM